MGTLRAFSSSETEAVASAAWMDRAPGRIIHDIFHSVMSSCARRDRCKLAQSLFYGDESADTFFEDDHFLSSL